jgi:WS/DGAT/MGAT family acyltransferase
MSIDRLGPLDRFMLRVSRRWPQDIGALSIIDGTPLTDPDGRFRIETVRGAVQRRLHLAPRFRQVIRFPRRGLGPPFWADDPGFDLAAHVRERRLEAPAGEAELLAAVEQLRRQPLDLARPMWEMWFLTGLADGRVGWFVKLHHAVGDGMAAMATIAALLDSEPDAPPVEAPAWRPGPAPPASALLADNLGRRIHALAGGLATLTRPRTAIGRVRAGWPALRELLAERPATRTSLETMVGADRRLALIRSRLSECRAAGRAEDATVNDVLLSAVAAGLRAVLQHRGEPIAGTTIRVYVPVSLRRRLRGRQQGNLIAQMAVPLELTEQDPRRRLRQIAAETARRKSRLRTSLEHVMRGGAIGRQLMLALVMRQRVNVTTASIPGPKRRRYLAGAPVLEVFPILPLVANEPLGVGALSYAGTLTIGIVADKHAFPDLDVFTAAVRDDLAALAVPVLQSSGPGATAPPSRTDVTVAELLPSIAAQDVRRIAGPGRADQ